MRVCLIGVSHPCHNPRLVREADTLAAAGHTVRVVAPRYMADNAEKDRRLMARRSWQLQQVDFVPSSPARRLWSLWIRGRRKAARQLYLRTQWKPLVELGYTLAYTELAALASREPADWFIAHTQAALPVAARAARRWKARLGFDCEDLLSEHPDNPRELVSAIERTYLPQCDYVSVPSQKIADHLAHRYAVRPPTVLYNVFPLEMAKGITPPPQRPRSSSLRLHWFGQVIGAGRGIEEAITAAGALGGRAELYLRGTISNAYRTELEALARASNAKLVILPQIDHDELVGSLAQYDVGLALERPDSATYAPTVSNKLFCYLLAGLAIAATDTPGQREVLSQTRDAGFMYPAGDTNELARRLNCWLENPQALEAAQGAAWRAARERYCWDIEQRTFLDLIQ